MDGLIGQRHGDFTEEENLGGAGFGMGLVIIGSYFQYLSFACVGASENYFCKVLAKDRKIIRFS